jgi:hypothetical protein
VIGERVGELGRDGTNLVADSPEIVEQPCAFLRQLGEQLGEPEDVYGLRS